MRKLKKPPKTQHQRFIRGLVKRSLGFRPESLLSKDPELRRKQVDAILASGAINEDEANLLMDSPPEKISHSRS